MRANSRNRAGKTRAPAALLLQIAPINSFNRIAVPTRQIAGNW